MDRPARAAFFGHDASDEGMSEWLPTGSEADEPMLFHVVHDIDGDEEDLEEYECRDAIKAYNNQLLAPPPRGGPTISWSRQPPARASIL